MPAERLRAGDQVRLPEAGAQVPPRPQPGRQGGRGALQGGGGGLQRPRRPGQAPALRRFGHAGLGGSAGFDPTIFADFGDILGRLLRLRRRVRAASGRPPPRRPTSATTSSSPSRRPPSAPETAHPDPAVGDLLHVRGQRRRAGHPALRLPDLRRQRPGDLPAGLLQRGPHLRALPRRGADGGHRQCKQCRGQGHVAVERKLQIKIPPGVDTGSQLRISGEGEPGTAGGPPGDLYVVVRVKEHAFFKRDGANLFCEVPVSITQAALGASVEVPTLDGGTTKLHVPEGTQPGTVLRIRGQGVPHLGSKGRGDLHVLVRVVVPRHAHRRAAEALRAARPHPPRPRPRRPRPVAPRQDEGHPRLSLRAFRSHRVRRRRGLATALLWEAGTQRASRSSLERRGRAPRLLPGLRRTSKAALAPLAVAPGSSPCPFPRWTG